MILNRTFFILGSVFSLTSSLYAAALSPAQSVQSPANNSCASLSQNYPNSKEGAQKLIQDLMQCAQGIAASAQKNQTQLLSIIENCFDVEHMAQKVLGTYRSSLTPDIQASYYKIFKDSTLATYSQRFFAFNLKKFAIKSAEKDTDTNNGWIVLSEVTPNSADAQPIQLKWSILQVNNKLLISDITLQDEGLSLTQLIRDDFKEILTGATSLKPLMDELNKRLAAANK